VFRKVVQNLDEQHAASQHISVSDAICA